MANVYYDGDIVNSIVNNLKTTEKDFYDIEKGVKSATSKLISARGFDKYIGGVSSDSFSSVVVSSQTNCDRLINSIRQKQVEILAYNKDADGIETFLEQLSDADYKALNLGSINDYISLDKKAGTILKGAWNSALMFFLGVGEGLGEFVETGVDLVDIGITGAKSLFIDKDKMDDVWEKTRARVSKDHVSSYFDNLYETNNFLKNVKSSAYGGETVRQVGKGLGYAAGIIGLTAATGGIAGAGAGVAGFGANAAQLGMTAGVLGVSKHTEEAWNDGAKTSAGLKYGVASGAWEGLQWFAGAKINALGGARVGNELFRGGAIAAFDRVGLSALDAGAEGIVQPGLKMLYKDYGKGDLLSNYKAAYTAAGGADNIFRNALIGAVGATIGETVELQQAFANQGKKVLSNPNLKNSAEVVAKTKTLEMFKTKYPELANQYGDDLIDSISSSKLTGMMRTENMSLQSGVENLLGEKISSFTKESLSISKGYKNDIADVIANQTKYRGNIDDLADKIANELFVSTNVAKIKANTLAASGKFDEALQLMYNVKKASGTARMQFDNPLAKELARTDLFRSLETYSNTSTTRNVAFKLFKKLVKKEGYTEYDAATQIGDSLEQAIANRGFVTKKISLADGREATIHVQNDLRLSSNNGISIEQFEQSIKNMPKQLQKTAPTDYYYLDTFNPNDLYWSANSGVKKYLVSNKQFWSAMTCSYNPKKISVWNCCNDSSDMIHELGHAYDSINSYHEISTSTEWQRAANLDIKAGGPKSITKYGATQPGEDFAESVQYYFTNAEKLKQKCPNRFAYLEKIFGSS